MATWCEISIIRHSRNGKIIRATKDQWLPGVGWGQRRKNEQAQHRFLGKCDTVMMCAEWLSRVWLFVTPWTLALQASLSMGILQARILEWVAVPSLRGSSQPRDQTQVSHIAGSFFTVWVTREDQIYFCTSIHDLKNNHKSKASNRYTKTREMETQHDTKECNQTTREKLKDEEKRIIIGWGQNGRGVGGCRVHLSPEIHQK